MLMNFIGLNAIPAWELQRFLTNGIKYAKDTITMVAMLVGVVVLAWGFIMIAKGFFSRDGQQVPWFKGACAIVVGGVMAFGTWHSLYSQVGNGMNNTITNMGNGTSHGATPSMVMPNVTFR